MVMFGFNKKKPRKTPFLSEKESLKTLSESMKKLMDTDRELESIVTDISSMSEVINERIDESDMWKERFGIISDIIPDGLISVDTDHRIVRFNAAAEDMLGYREKELIGEDLDILLFDDIKAMHRGKVERFVADDTAKHYLPRNIFARHKDGHKVPVEISVGQCRKTGHMYAVVRDMSARVEHEQTLHRKSKILEAASYASRKYLVDIQNFSKTTDKVFEKVGNAIDVSRVYLFLRDKDTDTVSCVNEWTDGTEEEFVDNELIQDVPICSFEDWFSELAQFKTIQGHVKNITNSSMKPVMETQNIKSYLFVPVFCFAECVGFVGFDQCDRERVWNDDEMEALRAVAGSVGAAIERRKQTEIRIQSERLQRTLQTALDRISDVVILTDASHNIIFVNTAFSRVYGYDSTEVIGRDPTVLHSDAHSPEFYTNMKTTLKSNKTWSGIITNRAKSGDLITNTMTIIPIRNGLIEPIYYLAIQKKEDQCEKNQKSKEEPT